MSDKGQVGGDHYKRMTIQPWDALKAWLTREQFAGYLIGDAVAYLARFNAKAPGKGGIADLKKARHCLDALIEFEDAAGVPGTEELPQIEIESIDIVPPMSWEPPKQRMWESV